MAHSPELVAAIAAAALLDADDNGQPCPPCLKHEGLCVGHAPHVLPQLKEPSWYRDAHSGKWHQRETAKERKAAEEATKDPKVKKAKRRDARRRGPRNWERSPLDRLDRALAGESTPVRRRIA